MRNASRMARYMMMRGGDNGGGNYGARDNYGDMRGNMRMGYGGDYERETEVRNGYGGSGNEGGSYARDNYGVDNRFRDRRGREHYDNGRFAPRNAYGNMGGDYSGGNSRGGGSGGNYGAENRGGREGEMRGGGGYSEMRGAMDDEESGTRMNVIGFDRPQEMTSHYPSRVDYHGGNEMEHRSGMKMAGGAMGANERGMDKETAEEWVHRMKNADGTEGEHWRLDQVKALMSQKALDRNPFEIYAVMNAMYSDYGKVLKKRGITTPDAYLDMALAFINDPDAVENKAAAYYEYIVKH